MKLQQVAVRLGASQSAAMMLDGMSVSYDEGCQRVPELYGG